MTVEEYKNNMQEWIDTWGDELPQTAVDALEGMLNDLEGTSDVRKNC